ncbi:MAG: HEAT repeat domain-containing protein [Gemmatimonadaceae bacterium]|nr:HEAT repeat domain-containing protein [Gemmatimonadaceae bacterium]
MTGQQPDPSEGSAELSVPLAVVTQLMNTFTKAVRAYQLYLPNNPMYSRAIDSVREAFAAAWGHTDEITVQITESQFRMEGQVVLEEPGKSGDSLPWTFYKDGIREIKFSQNVENEELPLFLQILQKARTSSPDDDDLLTLMWEQEFSYLQYRYVDFATDTGAGPVEALKSSEPPERIDAPRDVEAQAEGEEGPAKESRPGVVKMDDFDSTLYFLDESEIEYMQTEIRKDYSADLRPPVIASLLDTFEQETDPTVREEIIGILDYVLLIMLATTQFRTAAYLLRETALSAQRSQEMLAAHQQRLGDLTDRVSDPTALSQLLQALEDTPLRPPQNELNELFMQLKPVALETVLGWTARTNNNELRLLLENAASRLAASHTAELVRLIASGDDLVSMEAMRRAGALKTPAAVAALGQMIATGEAEMRLAAVNALSEIASPGAMQVLERAIEDADRDIRVAAVRILGARTHRPSLLRIENAIKGKNVRESNLTEKMAFFEAFGAMCGDGGILMLDGILNAKGGIGNRVDPELRACAALALGKVGSSKAAEALRKASAEKDVIVRNAVGRALRGSAL